MRAQLLSRSLIAAASVFALSSFFALAPASAQQVSPTPTTTPVISDEGSVLGMPDITTGSPLGYYIWKGVDDNRVHVATHGPGDEHEFVARLHTDGTFENIDTTKLEADDSYQLLDGGHTMLLDFHTYQYTDDIAFSVVGADHMRLDLNLDGSPIDTGSVFLGPTGRNPATNPFRIRV